MYFLAFERCPALMLISTPVARRKGPSTSRARGNDVTGTLVPGPRRRPDDFRRGHQRDNLAAAVVAAEAPQGT